MIGSYEVGATFIIEDAASSVLAEMAEQVEAFAAAVNEAKLSLASFGDIPGVARLTEQFAALQDSVLSLAAASSTMGDGLAASFTTINEATASASVNMSRMAASMEAMSVSATTMAGGGGARGIEDGEAAAAGGGFLGGKMFGLPALAAGFGTYESLKSGMNMEDTVDRMMIAMGLPVDDNYMETEVAKRIQETIEGASLKSGFSLHDMQAASLDVMRTLNPRSADERMELLPGFLDFAGVEARNKANTSPEEAVQSAIGLAHQLQDYTPDKIEPLLKEFTQLSMASPQSLTQLTRMFGYSLPLLTAGLHMDPTELMAAGIAGSQMGLGTKSGTWMSAWFSSPFTADLTGKRQTERFRALKELGLVDEGGKVVTNDPLENLRITSQHLKGLSPEEGMKDVRAASGIQGGRFAEIMSNPTVLENLIHLAEQMKSGPSVGTLQAEQEKSPKVQFEKAEQEFMVVLTNLGETVMPMATKAIHFFADGLNNIVALLGGPESNSVKAQKAHADAIEASNAAIRKETADWQEHRWDSVKSFFGFGAAKPATTAASSSAVNVGTINVYGAPNDNDKVFAKKMMDEFTKQLAQSQSHNLGGAEGTLASPYTSGAGY